MAQQPSGSPSLISFATTTVDLTAVSDVVWAQNAASTIAINGANIEFTLTPGHVYLCEADLGATAMNAATDDAVIQWVNAANAVIAGGDGGALLFAMGAADTVSNKPNTSVVVDLTATQVNSVVKLRATTFNSAGTITLGGTCTIRTLF